MNIFIIIALVVAIAAFGFYKHCHHSSLHGNTEQLRTVISLIFKEADKPAISQNRLIKGFKQHFHVNEKGALHLIGKARACGLIKGSEDALELAE